MQHAVCAHNTLKTASTLGAARLLEVLLALQLFVDAAFRALEDENHGIVCFIKLAVDPQNVFMDQASLELRLDANLVSQELGEMAVFA
jgi:uncharacterized membrane protein